MNTAAPLRILIVAEHASVRFGGEASIPYHYFRILRQRGMDAWLIVHDRTRAELQSLFPEEGSRILYVPDMALQKLFYRLSLLLPRRIAESTFGLANQLLTQHAQRSIAKKLLAQNTVIHQPIPVAPRFPSLLSGLGAPLVVGPLNGGMEYPKSFRHAEPIIIRAAISLGRWASDAVHWIAPGKKKAAVVLVANERTRNALPAGVSGQVIELVENGVDLSRWKVKVDEREDCTATPGKFLFIGRLVDWKALDLAIEALVKTPEATLDVIGDGPMRTAWENLSKTLQVQNRIRFHGWLSQSECAAHLKDAVGLVLPSLYECGGAVVLEAMAMSKPVIATNWGGPADYIDKSCGILIEPKDHAGMVQGFADGMQRLIHDPALQKRMGAAGRNRILQHFDWEKKIDTILQIYTKALESHAQKI